MSPQRFVVLLATLAPLAANWGAFSDQFDKFDCSDLAGHADVKDRGAEFLCADPLAGSLSDTLNMDVKLFTRTTWMGSFALLLALGEVPLAMAGEAIASDVDSSTAIFVTDEDLVPPSLPGSVDGSLVFIDDTPAPAEVQAPAHSTAKLVETPRIPRGDLKVVPNRQSQPVLRPLAQSPPAQPQATIRTIEPKQPNLDRWAEASPIVFEPGVVATENASQQDVSTDARQLIASHQLSLRAKTVAEYTQIIDGCASALQNGSLADDQRDFATQLSSWALNRRGQLRTDVGEHDLAHVDFETALDLNPRNWRALHNRGVSFAQAGQFAEAFDDFNAVIRLSPQYAKAYANRATLYVQAKDLQAATNDYEQAIQRDSKFATAYVGLGRVCHMLGRWEEAIDYFTTAIELEPTSADIICSRGDLHADMGGYAEALADYARTIELDAEFAHAYRNGAWLLATCPDPRYRDPENAVLGAEQALEYSYGEQHVALDTLAAALASNGQFNEAIATLTQAVELAPDDAKANYLTRLELYQQNQPFRTKPLGEVSQASFED